MDKAANGGMTENGGMSLGTVLFIVFLVLKLTNVIDWSWWWVTAPLWIPAALFIAIICVAVFTYFFWNKVR